MSEVLPSNEEPQAFTFDEFQVLTSGTAQYETAVDPETILRSGLVEEVHEYVSELRNTDTPTKEQVTNEIGDLLWYAVEISRSRGITASRIVSDQKLSLDDFQTKVLADPQISKIINSSGKELDPYSHPQEALAVQALRVVDVLNPESQELWHGYEQRLDLTTALRDLISGLALIAAKHDIKLSEAASTILQKLSRRQRQPHVIQKSEENALKSSQRYRLFGDEWIRSLFFEVTRK